MIEYKETKSTKYRERNWTREEVVLSVHMYFKMKDLNNSEKKRKIEELSELLRELAISQGEDISEIFRNVNGITMQLACLQYLDTGDNGLSSYSKLQQQVMDEYLKNPNKVNQIALDIISSIHSK